VCCFRWCGRQLCLRNMPISGVNLTPRSTAVYASDPASPRRPQDSLPPCLLGFGRTRLALASSHRLLLSHPASGSRTRPHAFLSRATPSAAFGHSLELIGCPISRSLTTCCVCLELRSLPSTGIARLQRYYEPLRRPMAPGLSPRGCPVGHSSTTPWGLPCCVRFPCVHAVANTPAQRLGVPLRSLRPSRVSLPRYGSRVGLRIVLFEACSAFTRVTACTLALSPYFVTRYPKASATSLPP
jgi:hypothetical protein